MLIEIESTGSFKNTERFLDLMRKADIFRALDHYGRLGADALASVTPVDTGLTAGSWDYFTARKNGAYWIVWTNSNMAGGVPVAILLQYGHGTGTGGYVQGLDYINPVIRPLFQKIADEVWKVVKSS